MGRGLPGHATRRSRPLLASTFTSRLTGRRLSCSRTEDSDPKRYLKAMGIKHNCTAAYRTARSKGSTATGCRPWSTSSTPTGTSTSTRFCWLTARQSSTVRASHPLRSCMAALRTFRWTTRWRNQRYGTDSETVEEYAAKVHQHAAEVSEAGIQHAALVRAAQEDRHRRNKRQDAGVRARLTFQKANRCT